MDSFDINKSKDSLGNSIWEITFCYKAGYVSANIIPNFNVELGDYHNEGGYDVIHLGREEIKTFDLDALLDIKIEYDYDEDEQINLTSELIITWISQIKEKIDSDIDYYYKLWYK
jgi:hypothetical protein